jgi:hypothetical protein
MPYTQAVLNAASFNPLSGCKESRHCNGRGGLLAFMEVLSPACTTETSVVGSSGGLSGGEIAGIVIGSVCGVVLVGVLVWMIRDTRRM